MTTRVEKTITVDVPVRVAYDQWTQFEEFPRFMSGVQSVTQLGDDRMQWVAEIGGVRRQWEARVLEQVPDQKVAWAATEGATNAGQVSFTETGGRTTVHLVLEYEPEGLVEKAGDLLNVVERQAEGDLQRFKEFIESEGRASGSWRGAVAPGSQVGAPGVEHAAASEGDSGKAGISGKAVAAGLGVAAAAAGAVAAASKSGSQESDQEVRQTGTAPAARPAPVVTQPEDVEAGTTTTSGTTEAAPLADAPAAPEEVAEIPNVHGSAEPGPAGGATTPPRP